jgi:hypothetical protein
MWSHGCSLATSLCLHSSSANHNRPHLPGVTSGRPARRRTRETKDSRPLPPCAILISSRLLRFHLSQTHSDLSESQARAIYRDISGRKPIRPCFAGAHLTDRDMMSSRARNSPRRKWIFFRPCATTSCGGATHICHAERSEAMAEKALRPHESSRTHFGQLLGAAGCHLETGAAWSGRDPQIETGSSTATDEATITTGNRTTIHLILLPPVAFSVCELANAEGGNRTLTPVRG